VSVRQLYDGSIARTLTPCRGAGLGGGRRIRHRRRARRRWRNRALSRGAYSHCLSGVAGPRMFMCPLSQAGPWYNPGRCGGQRDSPPANGRSARDGGLKACHSRAGLEARHPRAGHVGPPSE
jgi:hypothetical protein